MKFSLFMVEQFCLSVYCTFCYPVSVTCVCDYYQCICLVQFTNVLFGSVSVPRALVWEAPSALNARSYGTAGRSRERRYEPAQIPTRHPAERGHGSPNTQHTSHPWTGTEYNEREKRPARPRGDLLSKHEQRPLRAVAFTWLTLPLKTETIDSLSERRESVL